MNWKRINQWRQTIDQRNRKLSVSALILVCLLPLIAAAEVTAEFTWSPDRTFWSSSLAYHDLSHRYRESYVQPEHFTGVLDGCGSDTSDLNQPEFRWQVEEFVRFGVLEHMGNWEETFDSSWIPACRMLASTDGEAVGTVLGANRTLMLSTPDTRIFPSDFRVGGWEVGVLEPGDTVTPAPAPRHATLIGPFFPGEGQYRVRLGVREAGRSEAASDQVVIPIKDLVFAVLGDSYASGEGNPDYHGQVKSGSLDDIACEVTELAAGLTPMFDDYDPVHSISDKDRYGVDMQNAPNWLDLSAHRSMQSGHVQALRLISSHLHNSVGWSTTVLTFAVSGAKTVHIDRESQEFFHQTRFPHTPDGRCTDCAQIHELAEAVGNRPIEALILSIGGNDLGFSELIKKAVTGSINDADGDAVIQALADLPARYEAINALIESELNVGQVYLAGYPTDLLTRTNGDTGAGCGVLDIEIQKLSKREADLFRGWGEALQGVQQVIADQLSWTYVDVADEYIGHGYCTNEQTFLRSAERSCRIQGDVLGALHPNARGHAVYRDRIFEALRNQVDNKTEGIIVPIGRRELVHRQ